MSLFINYVANPTRRSPLNLAVARVLVCLYAAWKVGSYPFAELAGFPAFLFTQNDLAAQNYFLAASPGWLRFIPIEQAVIVVCLLLVALGWRTGVTAFVGALLLAHLSGLNYLISNEKTFLLPIYFLILYGLYRHHDPLTLDQVRARRLCRDSACVPPAPDAPHPRYPMPALRLFLVVFSLVYFFTGVAKWQGGGHSLAWAAPENIRLIVHKNALYHIHEWPPVAEALMSCDVVFALAGALTLLLELGFFVAVILRGPITPFILGLAGMHAGILATMQLNYLADMSIFYGVFLPWDELIARLNRARGQVVSRIAAARARARS